MLRSSMKSTYIYTIILFIIQITSVQCATLNMKQNQRLLSKHNRKNGLTLLHGQKRMKTIAPQSAVSPVTTKDLEKHAILPATHQSYKNRHPDGTDGSHAYHSGNVVPGGLENPQVKGRRFDEQTYWHNNPYWKYFKQIWGNAPMIDSNFPISV